ncbi:MAG: cyclase family protein [Dehalococcoidia bacterium]
MSQGPRDNWGRWGEEDEKGTLNHLTPESVLAALKLPARGSVYSLAMPISAETRVPAIRNAPWRWLSASSDPDHPQTRGSADEVLVLQYHGASTHIDGLGHMWYGGELYNGFPQRTIEPMAGLTRCGIDKAGPIIGRGVLLDVAGWQGVDRLPNGYAIAAEELEACAGDEGVQVRAGDVVCIRTGWLKDFKVNPGTYPGEPGPGMGALEWLLQRQVTVVGADNVAVEVTPPEDRRQVLPFHLRWLRDVGGYLIEWLELDELAADRVYEFLFIALPLNITGGAGSPITPVAVA